MTIHSVDLGYQPRGWQKQLHREKKQFSIAVCHRRAGKTWAAMHELLDCALRKPGGQFCYVAPFLTQAKKVMWVPLKEKAHLIPHTDISESELRITLPNGAKIWTFGADNADGLRGMGQDGIVADEFQLWSPDTLPAVFLPMLSGRNGWLLELGTPTGIDPLTNAYERAKSDPEWAAWKFAASQTGVIDAKELERYRANMPDHLFRLEYECDFDAGSETQLISGDLVEDAAKRSYEPEHYKDEAKIMACDIARQGKDSNVIARRQGFQLWDLDSWQSPDLMFSARKIAEAYYSYKPDALMIDGGGLGAGVVDSLRERGIPVIEVQFGAKASDARYLNWRAEMWMNMRQWLLRGGRIPGDFALKIELTSPRYFQSDKGQLQLESKEDLRKRGMGSPDRADAIAMTFAMPVSPQKERDAAPSQAIDTWRLW